MKTKHQLNLSAPVIHRGDQLLNNPIRRRWFALALGGLLLTSICALSPSPAQAQCKHWDVSGEWFIRHKDGGRLQVNLQMGNWEQQSANLTGTGRQLSNGADGSPDLAADITGNITGNSIAMKVTFGKMVRRYLGTVGSDGKIEGDCHFEHDPNTKVHWSSLKLMKCADDADKSSEDQHGKHNNKNKNKKKHHHHDDDQEQGNN